MDKMTTSMTLPEAPASVNADMMTDEELHAKLRKGIEDMEVGRVRDAKIAFNLDQFVMPPTQRGQDADAYVRELRDMDDL